MSTRSTRRATRANSRGTPSARHPSPPILDLHNVINRQVNTATPAARRARGESLPAVPLRESTAYGGAGIAKPASMKPRARAPLQETLQNILDDDEDDDDGDEDLIDEDLVRVTPDRRRRMPTPKVAAFDHLIDIDEDEEEEDEPEIPENQDDQDEQEEVEEEQEVQYEEDFLDEQDVQGGQDFRGGQLGPENDEEEEDAADRGNTPAGNSTVFGTPSAINGEANIRTPQQVRSSRRRPDARRQPDPRDIRNRATPPGRGKTPPPQTPFVSAFSTLLESFEEYILDPLWSTLQQIASFILNNWMYILGFLGSLAIATSCAFRTAGSSAGSSEGVDSSVPSTSGGLRWYGPFDFRHNIGQLLPRLSNPLTGDAMETVYNLLDRMRNAEYDIEYLKRQSSLGAKSISVLEKSLPDFIVSTKDKSGKVQIPKDFWNALKDKIHEEETWYSQPGSGATTKDLSLRDIERLAPKLWDEWMDRNAAKIRAWKAEDFEQAYHQHIKDSFKNEVLVPKSELVKMLEENYRKSRRDINEEIKQLSTAFEGDLHKVKSGAQKSSSKDDVHRMVADYLKKALPKVQLEALAQANLNQNLQSSLRRVNHFSLKTGAIIIPKLTAPNYDFGAKRGTWISRKMLSFMGRGLPRPNVPSEALGSWEEHGDCWCAPGPAPGSTTSVPQLAVFTGNNFYPDEIVIEHIPQSATLTPGSTPREMEAFAYIEDGYSRRPLTHHSYELMPNTGHHPLMDKGFVRIAKFTYDRDGPIQQAFPTQLSLASFEGLLGPEFAGGYPPDTLKPFTRKIVIRALNNYGEEFTCFYRVRVHGEIAEETDDDSEEGTFDQDEEI